MNLSTSNKINILAFIVLLLLSSCRNESRISEDDLKNIPTNASFAVTKDNSVKILFLGDLDFGESYQEEYAENILKTKGYTYSFQKIQKLFRESDYIIANLETSISPNDTLNIVDRNKGYIHYSDTILAPRNLKKLNIQAVSLANNHTMDFGRRGLELSERLMQSNHISTFGAGSNEVPAAMPLKLNISENSTDKNIYVIGAFQYNKTYNKSYSFYARKEKAGVNVIDTRRMKREIQLIKQTDPSSIIIMFPHWGRNYKWRNIKQKKIAKSFIHAGADIILGHGAHRIQEIELLHGKPILYSLGNSVFNSKGRFEVTKSIEYSILTVVEINMTRCILKCYPINSNNLKTHFQPTFVSEKEIIHLHEILSHKSGFNLDKFLTIEKDSVGYYFKLVSEF